MTVSLQTLLDRSDRNMAKGTKDKVRKNALELIRRAYKEGIYVQISEGYRSNKRQNELYAQGRTKPGNIVTNARAGQSNHNYGVAVDFFLVSSDGKRALWTVNREWRRVAQIGKELGFTWGGDWSSFKDYPHLEMKELKGGNTSSPTPSKGGGRVVKKIAVDGIRGKETNRRLQQFLGVKQDGIEGKNTVKDLQRFLNNYGQ